MNARTRTQSWYQQKKTKEKKNNEYFEYIALHIIG